MKQLSDGKGDAAIMPKLIGEITLNNLGITEIETSPQLALKSALKKRQLSAL
ncbi:MAG: hypothetical protein WA160_16675 [Pseudobdellovibrio sp.]